MASFDWKDVPAGTPALSIKQPWAWLILHAGKDIENRTWRTRYRGPLLIHAGKSIDAAYRREDCDGMDFGGIVGVVDLLDCVEASDSRWFTGPVGWVLGNPRDLPFLASRGRQGLWRPNIANWAQGWAHDRIKNPAFEVAREKGRAAARSGKPEEACPYGDHRTHRGAVTFSRAYIRAWLDGHREVSGAR